MKLILPCTTQPLPKRKEEKNILGIFSSSPQLSNGFVTFTAAGCTMGPFDSVIVIGVLFGDAGQIWKANAKVLFLLLFLNAFKS